uniref:Uncharacterized protein n=1 Tax=Arundo donax TaxID=35708 RepID=A0A0A9SUQ7_ARUDO
MCSSKKVYIFHITCLALLSYVHPYVISFIHFFSLLTCKCILDLESWKILIRRTDYSKGAATWKLELQ